MQKKKSQLLDHLIGATKQYGRHREPKSLGGLEIDDQLESKVHLAVRSGVVGVQQIAKIIRNAFSDLYFATFGR